MLNPMNTPGVAPLFGFLWKIYHRLNVLEKMLVPTVVAGYKPLFSNEIFSHPNFHIAVLGLIALTIGLNTIEVKRKVAQGSHHSLIEPLLKSSGWIWLFIEIWQHLNHIPEIHQILSSS